mmetsp:Transcript_140409/g.365050  ORF Transcript_140409/g.365050 Transcript_140409/m.365050 type:complete len:310 (+) Transcript_140409:1-930(+)
MLHFLPRALITALQGVACALQNPAYEMQRLDLREAAGQISAHIASRLHEFQPADLGELPSIFHAHSSSRLIEGSSDTAACALLSEQDLSLLLAGVDTKRPQSVGSMSTSAEESQEDDDCDQLCSQQIEVLDEPHASEDIDAGSDRQSAWGAPGSPRFRRYTDDQISTASESGHRIDQVCYEASASDMTIFGIEYGNRSTARLSGHPKQRAGQPPRVPGRKWTAAMAHSAQQSFDWSPWHVPVRSSMAREWQQREQAGMTYEMPMSVPVSLPEMKMKGPNFVPMRDAFGQEPMKVVSSYPAYISESNSIQ